LYSQILKLIWRTEFAQLVKKTPTKRHEREFGPCDHFVTTLSCQLGRASMPCEIGKGLPRTPHKKNDSGYLRISHNLAVVQYMATVSR
jgi:hypothetical protein